MIMKNRLSVATVAELMNVSEQFIRIGLQKGIFPFGYDVPTRIKDEVKQELVKEGHPELVEVGDEG